MHWYAVYTKSRQEKILARKLEEKNIEAYLPLRKTLRQWSDRRKIVIEPLIRSYVFVHIDTTSYDIVLSTPGAVRYIWFGGKPAAIPEEQINLLKVIAGSNIDAEPVSKNLEPGTPVRVIAGPMTGLTGELANIAGKNRFIVRLDHIEQSISLSISPHLLEVIGAN
jgi:transcriptional antiterminator RfaH